MAEIAQVRLLKWLKHPCVLTLFDVFLSADSRLVCLTTTYCESGDLAKIIKHAAKTKSLLGEKTVLGWFAQVRPGLVHAGLWLRLGQLRALVPTDHQEPRVALAR